MFGYSRNSGINWFRNYGDALHKYDNTTDIRGRKVEPKRPLGLRKSVDTYSIVKRDDGAIECVFYKTPVVTFMPDGEIHVRDYSYATTSTACFIGEVLGVRANLFNQSICISIQGESYRIPRGGDDVLILKRNEFDELRVMNPQKEMVRSVDRTKANNVRKRYKEFKDYAVAICKLKGGTFTEEEYGNRYGAETLGVAGSMRIVNRPTDLTRVNYEEFPKAVQAFFTLVDDQSEDKHDKHYEAILMLARSFGNYLYRQGGYSLSPTQVAKGVDALMFGRHRDEVFVTKECGIGELKKDTYAKYFQSGWQKYHQALAE